MRGGLKMSWCVKKGVKRSNCLSQMDTQQKQQTMSLHSPLCTTTLSVIHQLLPLMLSNNGPIMNWLKAENACCCKQIICQSMMRTETVFCLGKRKGGMQRQTSEKFLVHLSIANSSPLLLASIPFLCNILLTDQLWPELNLWTKDINLCYRQLN
jgi:hypothetical protein